jgi:peptidoglycan pentaglycine glycine transferase (the first glycine)
MNLEILRPKDIADSLSGICDFLDRQNTSHPFQYPQWASARSLFAILRQGDVIGWYANCAISFPLTRCFPALRGALINRGPVCDDPEQWRDGVIELIRCLEQEGIVYADASPDWIGPAERTTWLQGQKWRPIAKPRYSLRLDLTRDEEQLLSTFRKVTRYEIRRAERAGVEVRPPESAVEIDRFLNVHARMSERKGFIPDSAKHQWEIIRWLQRDRQRGTVLIAKYADTVIGGAVIVRAGRRCWYVWGASEKHESFSCGHLVQWRALLWAKSHGCTEYDFGGYTPGARSGPAWFKEGFGGSVVQFPPVHRLVLGSNSFRVLQFLSRA